MIDPNTTPLYKSKKNNFQPRVSLTYAPGKTVFRGGFGIFVGPGQTEDQIQPVESDRISSTLSNGAVPGRHRGCCVANFANNPNNRSVPAARLRATSTRFRSASTSTRRRCSRSSAAAWRRPRPTSAARAATCSCAASPTRSSQVVTNPNPASAAFVIREFSIVQRDATGNITGVQNPYAEVDYKTSGGHDSYNAMSCRCTRRSPTGLTHERAVHARQEQRQHAGSNEAHDRGQQRARRSTDFDYDNGYNNFDVRHTFNLSALYSLPFGTGAQFGSDARRLTQALLGGWDVGGIVNARSGLPVDVHIVRPDVVYRDARRQRLRQPGGRPRRRSSTRPGGGASRNVRRPDLVPGVDPFIKDGGLLFLNPAAFATPAPGTFGNLERNSIHGPNFKQVDLFFAKHFRTGGRTQRRVPRARSSTCSTP